MNSVLVPTDFSGSASTALDFAVESSKLFPLLITILHVLDSPNNLYTEYVGLNKEYNQIQVHEVNERLAKLKATLQDTKGVEVNTLVIHGGIRDGILQATRDHNIDCVMMGTSGAGRVKETIWGSRTSAVMAASQVPVITVPRDYRWKKPQRILFATNHFETASTVLETILKLTNLYQARLHVISFTGDNEDAGTFLQRSRETPHYERILKEKFGESLVNVENIFGESFEDALDEYIAKNNIDVLVMIPYKRSLPERIFSPSMTKHMACHTTVPLMTVPPMRENE